MAIEPINIGNTPDDGTGDPLRSAFQKCNNNFQDLKAQITAITSTPGPSGPAGPQGPAGVFMVVTDPGASRSLGLADASKWLRFTNAGPVSIVVSQQGTVAWPSDTEIQLEQAGAGQVTVAAGAGVTIRTSNTLKTAGQYSVITLKRVALNEWVLTGEKALT